MLLVGSSAGAPAQSRAARFQTPAPQFSVPPILQKAITASKHLRYSGRRVVQFWRQDKSRKHEEIVTRDGIFTRVEFPAGSPNGGQVIVENKDDRRHYFPSRNELLIQPPRHEESTGGLARIARQGSKGRLQFATGAGLRVAGFQTELLTVSDINGNLMERLYIEPNSGMVLRREVFDPGGAKIGYFEFTQIDINPPAFDPSLFRFERKGVRIVTPYDRLRDMAVKNGFQPLSLPPKSGFKLDTSRITQIGGQDVLVQSFWSARGKLSLFELKTAVDADRLRHFAGKDLQTYSWTNQGVTFVFVGTQSQDDLQRLSQMTQVGT